MTNPQWKRTERRIAALLGGVRVPVTGRQRGDVPDIQHPTLAIECKHRQSIPGWLTDAMCQAQACRTTEQLPIVVVHEHGRRYDEALVVMRLCDFAEGDGGSESSGNDGSETHAQSHFCVDTFP